MYGKWSPIDNCQSVYSPIMISIVNSSSLNVNKKTQEQGINIITQESLEVKQDI